MTRTVAGVLMLGLVVSACSSDQEVCERDEDCQAGLYCRQAACVFDCTLDAECHPGFVCTARGRCERGCSLSNGGVEICDGLDNDCDGETDESLRNRCGDCEPPDDQLVDLCGDGVDNDCDGETDEGYPNLGNACSNQGCTGEVICSRDGAGEVCSAPPPESDDSVCDGRDEDCDGETDEDADPVDCPLQQGVCAGAQSVCLPSGMWSNCDYGAAYTEGVDAICDTLDNDCDGGTDEDAQPLPVGEYGAEADDGQDNNCNGLADERGGVMRQLVKYPNVWMDVHETSIFDDPDCGGTRYGEEVDDYPAGWPAEGAPGVTLYACSLSHVLPSGHLSWYRSRWACEAQGKRLCTAEEWQDGCQAETGRSFPYGSNFLPGVCNDAWQANGENNQSLLQTGYLIECVSPAGIHDMSGNLAEWLQEWDPEYAGNAWTAGGAYYCELCSRSGNCSDCIVGDPADMDDIENTADCRATGRSYESFARNDARFYLGGRCCLDGP